jgi:hypothetical protein
MTNSDSNHTCRSLLGNSAVSLRTRRPAQRRPVEAILKRWRSVPTGNVSMWATIGPVPSRCSRYQRCATCTPTPPAEHNARGVVNVGPDGIQLRPIGIPVLLRVFASTSSAW